MIPTVPVSVWEQIPVVVIFAFLLTGGAWLMVKAFSKAVADINAHYANIIEKSNLQWQKYFDARSETNAVINEQVIEKLSQLTKVIDKLNSDFEKHDAVEISLLQKLAAASYQKKKNPNT